MSEPEFELVMPFIVCVSRGGAYDDDAFVAGWRLGRLDDHLARRPDEHQEHFQAADVPQVELIAMKHGYATEFDYGVPDWVGCTFTQEVAR